MQRTSWIPVGKGGGETRGKGWEGGRHELSGVRQAQDGCNCTTWRI